MSRLGAGLSRFVVGAALALALAGACATAATGAGAAGGGSVPTWHAEAVPPPAGAATNPAVNFVGLACPSATACVATGDYKSGTHVLPLLAVGSGLGRGGGGTWTTLPAPVPTGAATLPKESIGPISCVSPALCVAVGHYLDASGAEQAVVVSGAGPTWTASEVVLPHDAAGAGQKAHLSSISCEPGGTCTAVGQYTVGTTLDGMLVVARGPHWHARSLPRALTGVDPTTVACTKGNACAAISVTLPLQSMLLGSGGTWTSAALSPPAGGRAVSVASVVCPAPGDCISVGTYFDAKGAEGLVESQSGSSFVPTESPLPADASTTLPNGELTGIACATTTTCTAVGSYSDTAGATEGLILVGSGTTWSAVTAALPANGDRSIDSNLFDVSCERSGNCVAWGNYVDTNSVGAVMLLSGSGSAWVSREAPVPHGGRGAIGVDAVSLVAGTAVAIGSYQVKKAAEGFADVA